MREREAFTRAKYGRERVRKDLKLHASIATRTNVIASVQLRCPAMAIPFPLPFASPEIWASEGEGKTVDRMLARY